MHALIEQTRTEHTAVAREVNSLQLVTFRVEEGLFGVPMCSIREIIRVPRVVHVPLSPPSLEGMANLRGKVLPIIDLRTCFNVERAEHTEATRVIVMDGESLVGFAVDRVTNAISVDSDLVEPPDTIETSVNVDYITGIVRQEHADAGHQLVVLLDLAHLTRVEFSDVIDAQPTGDNGRTNMGGLRRDEQESSGAAQDLQLVNFRVDGQEYALPIERVQEIVVLPEELCQVPNRESHVLGVISLREQLLPVVSLRTFFNLPSVPFDEHNRVVVLSPGNDNEKWPAVGLVVDSVKEVLRLPASRVAPLPELLLSDADRIEISGICQLEEGRRLVNILSPDKMFSEPELVQKLRESIAPDGENGMPDPQRAEAMLDVEEQFVVFRLHEEEYGVRVEEVQEILRASEQFTHVPNAPPFIEGLASLRGTVLPVLNLRRRFGLAVQEFDERQRIIVLTVGQTRLGVIVDAVTEVLKAPRSTIGPAPPLSAAGRGLIEQVANFEQTQRMVLILAARMLIDSWSPDDPDMIEEVS